MLDKTEADIEDVLHPALFCQIINGAYELVDDNAITPEKLAAAEDTPRQVKQAEAVFRLLPAEFPDFSHYRPADWLIRNPILLEGEDASIIETLDRAETICRVYNDMLN